MSYCYYCSIKGLLSADEYFLDGKSWGETGWQSGIERWILSFSAPSIDSKSLMFPDHAVEIIVHIDPLTIKIDSEGKYYMFDAVALMHHSIYYTTHDFDPLKYGTKGYFVKYRDKIVGDFEIISEVDPTAIISWYG